MIEKAKDYLPDPDGRAEIIGADFLRASKIVLTDRSFEDYLGYLQIQPEQLGKRVLDIGSGLHELFSKSAAFYGIKVDSLNPKLKFKKVRKHLDDCSCLYDKPVFP